MTKMTIVDVVNILYPEQVALGNVTFGQGDNGIVINSWSVPDVPRPTVQELEDMIPTLQQQFDIWYFLTVGKPQLTNYIDSVAQQKNYDSAVSCASYANSTVEQWKNEAETFIAWRDFVYTYTLNQSNLMQQGERSVPTFEEFSEELPTIIWP